MTMLIGLAMLFLAALLLAAAVGYDVHIGGEPAGAGAALATLVAAVAVMLLLTTGIAVISMTWVLSVMGTG